MVIIRPTRKLASLLPATGIAVAVGILSSEGPRLLLWTLTRRASVVPTTRNARCARSRQRAPDGLGRSCTSAIGAGYAIHFEPTPVTADSNSKNSRFRGELTPQLTGTL